MISMGCSLGDHPVPPYISPTKFTPLFYCHLPTVGCVSSVIYNIFLAMTSPSTVLGGFKKQVENMIKAKWFARNRCHYHSSFDLAPTGRTLSISVSTISNPERLGYRLLKFVSQSSPVALGSLFDGGARFANGG
jgi:hypothetical protein